MSSNHICASCGISYSADTTTHPLAANLCPFCSITTAPLGLSTFTPITPVASVERVQGIFIRAAQPEPLPFPVNINIHYEQGKTHRVPQLDFLGPRDSLFYITIKRGPAGQLLSSPYHIYFQTHHRDVENQCVSAITNRSPKYKWFGDIYVLKFDGRRMERFTHASLTDDMGNVIWFFMNEAIPSQEAQV